ncbi:MAG: hypothetical protein ACKOQ4_13185 [Mycobacterium sp.]
MIDDRDREVGTVLSGILGRQLRTSEVVSALGVSRSAYYLAREEGRLVTADNLLRLAAAFGINPVDLLVRYELISADDVLAYADPERAASARATRGPRLARLQPRRDAPPI